MPGAPAPSDAGRTSPAGVPVEPDTARIAVDLLGGDDAPAVVVDGALRALGDDPHLHLLLVGPPEVAGAVTAALDPADRTRITVRAVRGAVAMSDHPTRAIRADTTVRAACAAVADGTADAVVSAGSTGALVTAAALSLGRWPAIRRPALVATLPAVGGPVVLLDVGGGLEARAATLVRHALLGAAYATVIHDLDAPRVGLLSVGTEAGKGDRVRKAADLLLAETALPGAAHYVGLVEGHDIPIGDRADVVVTDGFTGNILLKAIEGAYATLGQPASLGAAPRAATLLGVPGAVAVCHGAAQPEDIASGIALAARLHRRRVVVTIADLLDIEATPARPRRSRSAPDATTPPPDRSGPDADTTPGAGASGPATCTSDSEVTQ